MLPVNGIRSFTQIIQDNNTPNKTDGISILNKLRLQALRSWLAQGKESQGSALRHPSSRLLLFNKPTDF